MQNVNGVGFGDPTPRGSEAFVWSGKWNTTYSPPRSDAAAAKTWFSTVISWSAADAITYSAPAASTTLSPRAAVLPARSAAGAPARKRRVIARSPASAFSGAGTTWRSHRTRPGLLECYEIASSSHPYGLGFLAITGSFYQPGITHENRLLI